MKKLIFFILSVTTAGFLISCESGQTEPTPNNQTETSGYMLQHNVYFYLNENVSEQEKSEFEEGLRKITAIESIHKFELGIPGATAERDVTDHSYAYAIFSWFTSLEDYKTYDEHPVHLEFIDSFNHLWADVKVYDSEIIESNL
ncbi:MAG TPA: Dabb family protein [Balneolaceae bacterium]|nr:Dabb family protein [Balneolaceae bacterium]